MIFGGLPPRLKFCAIIGRLSVSQTADRSKNGYGVYDFGVNPPPVEPARVERHSLGFKCLSTYLAMLM